jgi:hypothetical protein
LASSAAAAARIQPRSALHRVAATRHLSSLRVIFRRANRTHAAVKKGGKHFAVILFVFAVPCYSRVGTARALADLQSARAFLVAEAEKCQGMSWWGADKGT